MQVTILEKNYVSKVDTCRKYFMGKKFRKYCMKNYPSSMSKSSRSSTKYLPNNRPLLRAIFACFAKQLLTDIGFNKKGVKQTFFIGWKKALTVRGNRKGSWQDASGFPGFLRALLYFWYTLAHDFFFLTLHCLMSLPNILKKLSFFWPPFIKES